MEVEPEASLLATALASEPSSPAWMTVADGDVELLERNRVAAAVAVRTMIAGGGGEISPVLHWRLRNGAARVAMLLDTLDRISEALGGAEIAWAPIKGGDLAFRAYEHPEDRDFGDLDVLIAEHDRRRAVSALRASGWRNGHEEDSLMEAYLHDEGYCETFTHSSGIPVELHHRVWGSVPAALGDEVMAAAMPDPSLGASGRRVTVAHAFVIAAFHVWTVAPPRALSNWWDLERLARLGGAALVGDIEQFAGRWELQLPVGLAALVAGSLWPRDVFRSLAQHLLGDLRLSERILVHWCARRGADAVPFWSMVLARLLAGRPSRHGWRSVWRRLRPHPALRASRRGASARPRSNVETQNSRPPKPVGGIERRDAEPPALPGEAGQNAKTQRREGAKPPPDRAGSGE